MITIKELAELGQKYNVDIRLETEYPDFVFLRKNDDEMRYGVRIIVALKDFVKNPEDELKSCSEFLEWEMSAARLNELRMKTIPGEG